MPQNLVEMDLDIWNLGSDHFNYAELFANFQKINGHDHTTGKGLQVPTGGIANLAITAAKLADLAVTTAKINDDAVTAAKIADNAVGTDQIAADAVGTSELAANAVGTSELANDSVDTAAIINATVTLAKLSFQVLWGEWNPDGSVNNSGSGGWSVSKTGTGVYRLDFATNFSAIPVIVPKPMYRGAHASIDLIPDAGYDPTSLVDFYMSVAKFDEASGSGLRELTYTDGDYGCAFVAIGPR
jgi:hypothetical protein